MIKVKDSLLRVNPYPSPLITRKNMLKFDLNENTMGCSSKVIDIIRKINYKDVAIYPEYSTLSRKIADFYNIDTQNILLTNGADDAIRYILDAYLKKGDEIILPVPSFSLFKILAKLKEVKIIEILYNKNFSFPIKKVLNSITEKTKMIIIVNPNSPLGTSLEEDDLIKILTKAKNSIILLDETYCQFAKKTYIKLVEDFCNLIVVQTFSKAFGLAGLRLGFIASNEKNIRNLKKLILPYPVNSVAVLAGIESLKDRNYIKKIIRNIDIEKDFLYKSFKKLGVDVYITDTNFLLVNLGKWSDKIYMKLIDRNILVKNLKDYPLLNGFLRISVGMRRDNLRLLRAFQEIIPPEAILFDMDGVLVDVSSSYVSAIKETFRYFARKNIDVKEIEKYKIKSGYNNDWVVVERILLSQGIKISRESIIEKFQHFYLGDNFDGLINNEKWLLNKNILGKLNKTYKLGIVTGRPRKEVKYTLNRFKMEDYFDVIVAMEDVSPNREKPNPYGIKKALKKMNVKRAFYLGDNIDDIKSGVSAGVIPIGVVSCYLNKEKTARIFKNAGAKFVLKDVNEIMEVLE